MDHDPYSKDTDRRVFAMIGTVCKGCRHSCGDLERCPVLLARWFGDWSGEFAVNMPVAEEPEAPRPKVEVPQLSLF